MQITREFEDIIHTRLSYNARFIQAIIGPRQVGKTTGIKAVLKKLPAPQIYESADGLGAFGPDWLTAQWQRAAELGPGTILVIDEIHKVENWSEITKKLYDQYIDKNLTIVLLGSASFKILRGLQDSLAGRFELTEVPHWSFYEMNLAFKFSFEDYLKFGGYPAPAALISDELRWEEFIRNSIVENVLAKDLSDLVEIRSPALLRQVFLIAMGFPAQEISFQKMVGQLQDKGAVATVKHYLEILESARLLKLLYKYSKKASVYRSSSPKILPMAPALINSIASVKKVTDDIAWRGRVFESAIGAYLACLAEEIYYWRDGKYEVDFIVKLRGKIYAVEVKLGNINKLAGLKEFCNRFPEATPLIVDYEKGTKLLNCQPITDIKKNPDQLLKL